MDNMIAGLLGGLMLGSIAVCFTAGAAYVVTLVVVECRRMWRDER